MNRFHLRLHKRFPNRQNARLEHKSAARRWKTWINSGLAGIFTMIVAVPVMANDSNFGTIRIAPGFDEGKAIVSGYTGGHYPLSAISKRDRDRNMCIGFADPTPDHILILEKDFSNLQILVDSLGADTTLLLQGPDEKTLLCGDDTGRKKDASINGKKLKAGTYRLWVGIFNRGMRANYTLSIRQPAPVNARHQHQEK